MIKEVPADAPLRPVMFGDGAKGMAIQQYRSDEYKVNLTAERESRDKPFTQAITHDELDGVFTTLDELNEAIRKHNEQRS